MTLCSIFNISFRKSLIICSLGCVCACVIACVRVCVCVCELVYVFLWSCNLCCVYLCAWEKHSMIRAALGIIHLKRNILFITCTMWRIVKIVIWPLFRKMPVNQNPLNRIGIFWYQFTPRKLLYLLVSLNLVNFGPHWLSVFIGPPCIWRVPLQKGLGPF